MEAWDIVQWDESSQLVLDEEDIARWLLLEEDHVVDDDVQHDGRILHSSSLEVYRCCCIVPPLWDDTVDVVQQQQQARPSYCWCWLYLPYGKTRWKRQKEACCCCC